MVARRRKFLLKNGLIGVIADTHGLIRPEALAALKGSELIVHAGDIGKPEVLDALHSIAPVAAIRGNNDRDGWAKKLPDILNLRVNGLTIYVIHAQAEIQIDPAAAGMSAVLSGHSHKPSTVNRDGVLFLNPGSAGPRRFKLPVTVGKIRIIENKLSARIFELKI